jgi:hypothetical protein
MGMCPSPASGCMCGGYRKDPTRRTLFSRQPDMLDRDGVDNPWNICETDYPTYGSASEQLRFLVGYAILAPSHNNSQPWRFRIADDEMELWLDPTRALPVADAHGREAHLGCGTGLFFLRLAAQYFGHVTQVDLFPSLEQENLLARLRLGELVHPNDLTERLFYAIRHRRTWTGAFEPRLLTPSVCAALEAAAVCEGAGLVFLTKPDQDTVAELAAAAEQELRSNPDFVAESVTVLTTWVRAAPDSATGAMGKLAGYMGRLMSAALPAGWAAAQIQHVTEKTPGIAVLTTPGDTPYDWLAAGQALGTVLLEADAHHVEASCLSGLVEAWPQRWRLQALVHGTTPQVVLRLGYPPATPVPHASRRPVRKVTVNP